MTKACPDMPTKRLKDIQQRTARKLRHRAGQLRKTADELEHIAALMSEAPAPAAKHDETRADDRAGRDGDHTRPGECEHDR